MRWKPRGFSTGSFVLLIVTLLLMVLGAALVVPSILQPNSQAMVTRHFDLQGHRGARGLYPENSLPGFAAAVKLGVTTLEMDTGLTRDGVVVVHHDRRLDANRTRGPNGAWLATPTSSLVEIDFAALAQMDIGRSKPGSRVATRFPNQQGLDNVRIPSLVQVLAQSEALAPDTLRYNIELKVSPPGIENSPQDSPDAKALADAVVAVLRAAKVTDRASIQSFDWQALAFAQTIAPEISTVYLTAEQSWLDNLERGQPGASPWTAGLDIDEFEASVPRAIKHAGGAVWSPYFRDLRAADLRAARNLGLKVVVWTVNKPADMASLIDRGVDGIITDYPDRLRKVMAQKGLSLPPAFAAAN